ncbi:FRG domain-containing protein [candidate division KSB1 bacterium]|nr:FRG domain-containing protein [candidate division KSB1 bacterium]
MERYFKGIPTWSNDDQRFVIMTDEWSGRIPVTKLEHWREFTNLLESDFFNPPNTQLIFRGHRRYDWGLTPSLGRVNANDIVTEALAQEQLELFRRAVRGRIPDNSLVDAGEEDELWSVGQHHGLKTPMIDFTHSPYVALFFTFVEDDDEDDNPYRAIFVLNKSFMAENSHTPNIRVLEPKKDYHGRLVNQAGLFIVAPYNQTIANEFIDVLLSDEYGKFKNITDDDLPHVLARYICKIYIKNEDREGCLRHLRRMNVHHASLFPDLIGASEYCNILIEEHYLHARIDEAGKQVEIAHENADVADVEEMSEIVDRTFAFEDKGGDMADFEEVTEYNGNENLYELLKGPTESSQVESGRIKIIANELEKQLEKHKLIDWESREAIQAKLRNVARAILRKFGYPVTAREQVVEKLIEVLENDTETVKQIEDKAL